MSSNPVADAWYKFFSPTIHFPGSGSLGGFTYQPYTKWEAPALFRGNDTVEQVVYREVASPGRQLGKLTDVVIELADALARLDEKVANSDNLKKLKQLAASVENIKNTVENNAEEVVRADLDKLEQTDRARFKSLIEEYSKRL